jgi:pyruvate/2-oxoglutarate dehydrogenase complex dihydrolipoamide dehydrogenase (E3) component
VLARRDMYVTGWDDSGQADFLTGIGADLIRGHGRLAGPRRVTVEVWLRLLEAYRDQAVPVSAAEAR